MGKRIVFDSSGKPKKLKDINPLKNDEEPSPSKQLIWLDVDQKWFDHDYNEVAEKAFNKSDEHYLNQSKRAEKLLNRELDAFEKKNKQFAKSEDAFLDKIVETGTMSDRLSAVQLKIQQNPVHAYRNLVNIINFFKKKQIRTLITVLKCLREIFVKDLLPPNRKLVPFEKRPLDQVETLSAGNVSVANKRLILWKFESDLKDFYDVVVKGAQELTSSQVEGVAEKAVVIIADLLSQRPEQEQFLLNTLVQKIGHPKKKVDVTATENLKTVVEKHPNMRPVIVSELERLIFRKNIAERTQFYAIHSLNLIPLRAGDAALAVALLRIYFAMFRILIQKRVDSPRLLTSVIRGANRAFPLAKDRALELADQLDDIYKVVHSAKKLQTSLSALRLLFQMLTYNAGISDRFYSAFYQRMLTVRSSSADIQFFDLTFKVLKSDPMDERVRAFVKRLLQLALVNTPAFAAAALLLYNALLQERPSLIQLIKHSDKTLAISESGLAEKKTKFDDSDDDEHYEDVPLKEEKSVTEVNGLGDALNGKLKKKKKKVKNGTELNESVEVVEADKDKLANGHVKPEKAKCGWVYRDLVSAQVKDRQLNQRYDPMVRNPLFANAQLSVDSELHVLSQHYHPSVAVFANYIIDGVPIQYKGNALIDFTLIRFLDRFAFKNPKLKQAEDGKFKGYIPSGVKKMAITSKEYAHASGHEVPQDERFLHRFASMKMNKNGAVKKEGAADDDRFPDDDNASVNSDEFDALMGKIHGQELSVPVSDQFEPGEKNEEFEVDFSDAFGRELSDKEAKAKLKRARKDRDAIDYVADDESDDAEDMAVGEESDMEEFEEEDEDRGDGGNDDDDDDDGGDDEDDDEPDDDDEDDESDDEDEFKPKNLKKLKRRGFQDSDDDLDDDTAAKAFDIGNSLSYLRDAEAAVEQLDDIKERAEARERKFQRKRKAPKPQKRSQNTKKRRNH